MNNTYSIIILRSIEDIETYREAWEKLQWHPHTDIDYYKLIVSSRQEIIRPHVLVILKNSVVTGLVICRLEDQFINCKIGYTTIYRARLKMLTVLYGGFLGYFTTEMSDIVIMDLVKSLYDKEADVIYFNVIRKDNDIYKSIINNYNIFGIKSNIKYGIHWRIKLPDSISDYLNKLNGKHRYNIRRYPRILENNFPGKVKYIYYRNEEDVSTICKDAEIIAEKTYHRGLGVGFINDDEYKKRLLLQAKNGHLFALFLYIDGKPVAFWVGSIYRNILYLAITGYDMDLKKYELGTILLIKIIENCINLEPNVKEIDFGFGDSFYKRNLGTDYWEEVEFYVFSKSVKSTIIKSVRSVIMFIDNTLRIIVLKLKIEGKIKKYWRKHLSA